MKLKPIGIDTQIEDCLFGKMDSSHESINMKIDFTGKHINDVIAVNGKPVFHPIVIDNDIFYFLSKAPDFITITDKTKRKYYYPIQYAEITFFNNKP